MHLCSVGLKWVWVSHKARWAVHGFVHIYHNISSVHSEYVMEQVVKSVNQIKRVNISSEYNLQNTKPS